VSRVTVTATAEEERDRAALRRRLLAWYGRNKRDLPWRRTRDPYAIWISEAMLQQTRVETVVPYYERFLERFPTVESLARSEPDAVLSAWAGLGYYSRARNLRRAAQAVVTHFGGELPDATEALQSLPGIGRYTAGAIASIAFDRPAPIVDGNVARVLARLDAVSGTRSDRAVRERLWGRAEALARGRRPGDLNQALMELGARVCTSRSPKCGECPIASHCRARCGGAPERYPGPTPRAAPARRAAFAALIVRRGLALAVRRPDDGLLGGLWELPGDELPTPGEGRARARATDARWRLETRTGLALQRLRRAGALDVTFTHRRFSLAVYRTQVQSGRLRPRAYPEHRWINPERMGELPMATATRRAVAVALENWRG